MNFDSLKQELEIWSTSDEEIVGLAIVGSYVGHTQHPDSDIDVCLFVKNPAVFMQDHSWADNFGTVKRKQTEDWVIVKTLRVFYTNGHEMEFNFCTLAWADIPVDPETSRIVMDGIDILYDPTSKLTILRNHLCK